MLWALKCSAANRWMISRFFITASKASGTAERPATAAFMAVSSMRPSRKAKAMATRKRAVNWVLYAFVDATAISGPAHVYSTCLLYTSDAADDLLCVDLGGRRI